MRFALLTSRRHDLHNLAYLALAQAIPGPPLVKRRIQMGHKHRKLLAIALLNAHLQHGLIEYTWTSMDLAVYNRKSCEKGDLVIAKMGSMATHNQLHIQILGNFLNHQRSLGDHGVGGLNNANDIRLGRTKHGSQLGCTSRSLFAHGIAASQNIIRNDACHAIYMSF